MKILLVSAFAEDGTESGANRLRKLRHGLRELGHECDWLGPSGGFRSHGAIFKLVTSWVLVRRARRWAGASPEGRVLISLPPPWLLPAALALALVLSERLVVDFRDPILNQAINPRGPVYRCLVKFLEAALLQRAGLVIVAAEGIGRHISRPRKAPVTVLAGLDERDVRETRATISPRQKYKIVYGGTFYGSRSPLTLLEAIADFPGGLSLDLYVYFNHPGQESAVRARISALSLEGRVRLFPQVGRAEFLDILRGAGTGLVVTHSQGSDYAIPGKIFDYLSANVFIWVISRDRGLVDFLSQHRIPALVTGGWSKEELIVGMGELEKKLALAEVPIFTANSLLVKEQARILVNALEITR